MSVVETGSVRELGVPGRREVVADALVVLGIDAVEPLVRELADEGSPVDWRPIAAVLGRIGEAVAFDGLLRGLAAASGGRSRERLGFAFSGFGAAALDRYTAALSHPVPHVRRMAVRGLQRCGDDARSAVDALVPLLGDPDDEVAREAQNALMSHGEHVIARLRLVRERGPGRQRARALTVLAESGVKGRCPAPTWPRSNGSSASSSRTTGRRGCGRAGITGSPSTAVTRPESCASSGSPTPDP